MRETIYKKLLPLKPSQLEVIDQSHLHAGHAGNTMSGESHFKVVIKSEELRGMSRIQAHRLIHKTLGEIVSKIHALSIEVL